MPAPEEREQAPEMKFSMSDSLEIPPASEPAAPFAAPFAAPQSDADVAALQRARRGMALTATAYLLFYQITLRIHNDSALVITLSTLASLCLTLLCVVCAAQAMRSRQILLMVGGVAGLIIAPSLLVAQMGPRFPEWAGWRILAPVLAPYFRLLNVLPGLRGLLLIALAAAIGVLVSRMVREIKILLPIGVMLALVDLYVVFGGGLVAQAQQGSATAQAAMQSLTVALPTVQKHAANALPMPVVGFADYLFIALFFACFAKFGVPARRTFFALAGVLSLYMLYVLATGTPLPALVPIAAVIISMNLRRFRYERAEAFALFYAALIICAVFGFIAWRK